MECNPRAPRRPLPANYVSLAHLRDQWNLNQDRRNESLGAGKFPENIIQSPNDPHQRNQIRKLGAQREKSGFYQAPEEEIEKPVAQKLGGGNPNREIQKPNAEKLGGINPNREIHKPNAEKLGGGNPNREIQKSNTEELGGGNPNREIQNSNTEELGGRNPNREHKDIPPVNSDPEQKMGVSRKRGGKSRRKGPNLQTLEQQEEQKSKNSSPGASIEEEKPGETINSAAGIDRYLRKKTSSRRKSKSNPPVQIEKEISRADKENGSLLPRRNLRGDMVWIKKKESGD